MDFIPHSSVISESEQEWQPFENFPQNNMVKISTVYKWH